MYRQRNFIVDWGDFMKVVFTIILLTVLTFMYCSLRLAGECDRVEDDREKYNLRFCLYIIFL